ncbi:MAG: hypothetical protein AMXMBFR82_18250 [Candidatus Hydrogenedentota bacterium]
MPLFRRSFVLAVLAFLFVGILHAQEKHTLRLNLEPGQEFQQRMAMTQTIDQVMNGITITMNQDMTLDYAYKVTDRDADDVATVECTYQRIASKVSTQGMAVSYDSANTDTPVSAEFRPMAAMVGKSFTMRISPLGTVESTEGLSEILDAVVAEMSMEGPAREQVIANMKNQFGEEAMKDLIEQAMAIYPSEPVAVGDTWKKTLDIRQVVPMQLDNTWVLKEVNNDTATLEVTSLIAPPGDDTKVDMMGMELDVRLEGAQSGTSTIDRKTGWVVSSTVNQNVDGEMVFPAEAGAPTGMTIPIGIRSTVELGPVE